ncbi:glucosaminidase domain-containing protein [Treponema sp.]|uniref:glucosaminidase domain-containing protein n=1 Tax=Treponema sp. TaxID=166 RepID=UPI003F0784CF
MKKIYLVLSTVFILATAVSCVSTRGREPISRNLSAPGVKSEKQLYNFFMSANPSADKKEVARLAALYIDEAEMEGINSDCAFVQMCLETGFLRFGNLVTPQMHNYCGLGAIDAEHPGETFATEQLGVRAHIQHLHAYATKDISLNNECIDPRYRYVNPRGKSPTIAGLAGTWAADRSYSTKLEQLLIRLESF